MQKGGAELLSQVFKSVFRDTKYPSSYFSCCPPWQSMSGDVCMMSKTREKINLSMGLVPSIPVCNITLVGEEEFKLGLGGTMQSLGEGARGVEWVELFLG